MITSSPRLICRSPSSGEVRTENAIRLADDPELTKCAYLTPIHEANSFSNSSEKRPVVNQKSSIASVNACISFSSKTRDAYDILSPSLKGSFFSLKS